MTVLADFNIAQTELCRKILMSSNYMIMKWTANGFLQHQQESQAVLDIDNIDICLISESHFTK